MSMCKENRDPIDRGYDLERDLILGINMKQSF